MLLNSNLKLKKMSLMFFLALLWNRGLIISSVHFSLSLFLHLSVSLLTGGGSHMDRQGRDTYLYRVVVSRSCTGQHPLHDIRHPVLPLIFTKSSLLVFCSPVLFHQMHSRHSYTSFLPSSQTSKVGLKSVCHPPSSSSSHEGSNIILGGWNTLDLWN